MPVLSTKYSIHLLRSLIINVITAGVALGLALNRRNNREIEERAWPSGRRAPFVQVIAPARNEAENVGPLLKSLLAQSYPQDSWGVTLVNDGSEDATEQIAQAVAARVARLEVVDAAPLPPGWTGKNHAMYTGFRAAPSEAEWLLFVDADTRHKGDMLSSVVARAMETEADLLSLIITVEMKSFWECVIVPQVGELYTLLVGTMDQVNNRGGRAAANGQFILIRREVYAEVCALESVRSDVAEDRAIAEACKVRGYNVRLEYGCNLVNARVYSSLRDMWFGYTKTLFWASGQRLGKALIVAFALALYALVPQLALGYALLKRDYPARRAALANAPVQLIPMLMLRARVCKQMGISPLYAFTYPLGVVVGDAMLLFSAYRMVSGKGVRWKGRTYR
ncbi:MAG: glycosyltransferase [Chloroflexi bacterium]|nr:glycosyltransferase [Chloroflexota bacterium]